MCDCPTHSALDQAETDLAAARALLDRMNTTTDRIAALLTPASPSPLRGA